MTLNDAIEDDASRRNLGVRFWSKVNVRGADDCWLWTAKARHKFGYGAITVATGHVQTSHCVSWALHNGPIPSGAHVLHSCDVPQCCNPKHLRLGDAALNATDKVSRGRQSFTKHSPETIEKIKANRALNPPKQTEAARVSRSEAMRKRWASAEWRARFTSLTGGENHPRFGKRPPEHQIEAVRRGHRKWKGYRHTEETKQKIREAALARYRK